MNIKKSHNICRITWNCDDRLVWLRSQRRVSKAQAKLGQPIVRAIEDYYTQTGSYPTSLDALPQKHTGWTYETYTYQNSTNGAVISYMLRYRFGRGGVEYEPNRWIGGDKGHYVLLDVK